MRSDRDTTEKEHCMLLNWTDSMSVTQMTTRSHNHRTPIGWSQEPDQQTFTQGIFTFQYYVIHDQINHARLGKCKCAMLGKPTYNIGTTSFCKSRF